MRRISLCCAFVAVASVISAQTGGVLRVSGTVEAVKAVTIVTPRLSGPGSNSLVITRLASAGSRVRAGDVVVQFDPQDQVQAAQDRRIPAQDRNNIIYVPLMAAILRLEDALSWQKDEIDGIYLQMTPEADISATGELVRGLLNASHRGAGDFSVIVPAELLAQQQRTRRIFQIVMVAIASISLLVGGIGIMNIMLASVLERTREIGVRRAIGARRTDIVRQFLIETSLITITGGVIGIILGVVLSQLVGYLAGWSTIVTVTSVVLAFAVSVSIGLVFGLYPAMRASRLDPVVALHYE